MGNAQDNKNRSYFDFLITEFGFDYHGFENHWTIYISENIVSECYCDRSVPSMRFKMPSEPDNISISFDSVLEILERIKKESYFEKVFRAGLDEGIVILKTFFLEVAETIIFQPETWWLDSQKLGFDKDENLFLKTGQDVTKVPGYRKYYQYIKSKDPTWSSRIPVPDDWNSQD